MDFTECYPDSCSRLNIAARTGNLQLLQKLLNDGEDFCVKDNRGWFPIHEAASNGHAICVQELINKVYDVGDDPLEVWHSPFDCNDRNALVLAARNGHFETVKVLAQIYPLDGEDYQAGLEASVPHLKIFKYLICQFTGNINFKNKWDQTLLHIAVECCAKEVVQLLITYKIMIDACELEGRTALHLACGQQKNNFLLDIVKLLIENGSNVNACDNTGCSVLFIAAQKNHLDIVKYLIDKNADPYLYFEANLLQSDKTKVTPICIAAERGFVDVLKVLLQHMDPEIMFKQNMLCPVIPATLGLNLHILKVLFSYKNGVYVDWLLKNSLSNDIQCMTLFFISTSLKSCTNQTSYLNGIETLKYLLITGANIKPFCVEYFSSFIKGEEHFNLQILNLLVCYGAFEHIFGCQFVIKMQKFVLEVWKYYKSKDGIRILLDYLPVLKLSFCKDVHYKFIKEVPSLLTQARYCIRYNLLCASGHLCDINKLIIPTKLQIYLKKCDKIVM